MASASPRRRVTGWWDTGLDRLAPGPLHHGHARTVGQPPWATTWVGRAARALHQWNLTTGNGVPAASCYHPLEPKKPREGLALLSTARAPLPGLAAREEVKPVEWFRLVVLFVALVALVTIAVKL